MEKRQYKGKVCCDEWRKAFKSCTDNESYGQLITYSYGSYSVMTLKKHFYMGSNLLPIKFCPWCGTKKFVS